MAFGGRGCAPAGRQRTREMKKLILPALAVAALLMVEGCLATLNPTADPFVVRVEQSQTTAFATFDFVLHMDQSNRSFWQTNAPGFHRFCEALRTPVLYKTNQVPRCVAAQLNVDDLKAVYKAEKSAGNSNALYLSWSVLSSLISQSTSWSNIITNPIYP